MKISFSFAILVLGGILFFASFRENQAIQYLPPPQAKKAKDSENGL
jgi:hypothetical protein